ncbi:MAG: hypothetical protein WD872_12370 [Pirellulaceae bacterium]
MSAPGLAHGQSNIWQVEEDWELVLAEPDAATAGPQVTCTISPVGNIAGQHATFEVNYQTAPAFSAGGVHLHVWNHESRLSTVSRNSSVVLSTAGETIRWKVIMSVSDGNLTVDIDNGTSSTWGGFGDGQLISVATSLTNLDQYSPAVSVEHSGVGFASNRVQSLKITKIKTKRTGGQVTEDNTIRVVHD